MTAQPCRDLPCLRCLRWNRRSGGSDRQGRAPVETNPEPPAANGHTPPSRTAPAPTRLEIRLHTPARTPIHSRDRLRGIAQHLAARDSAPVFLPLPLQFRQEGFDSRSTTDPKWEAALPAAQEVMRGRAVATFKKRIAEAIVGRNERTDVDLCWPLARMGATRPFTLQHSGVKAESHYASALRGFCAQSSIHAACLWPNTS